MPIFGLGTLLAAQLLVSAESSAHDLGSSRSFRLGVSTFPFGPSLQDAQQTVRVAKELSDIDVIQLDDGVPWAEAAGEARFPASVQRKWQDLLSRTNSERPLYLALEPMGEDRVSLAKSSEGSSSPDDFRGISFDDSKVIKSYSAYARRAVRFFRPTYLNLGVESGELAARRPGEWQSFVRLIGEVTKSLRSEFPTLKIGISFGLQSLMEKDVADRAREIIELSDFVGISFYPYMSSFQEKFGLQPLPLPPAQWRDPLDWLRSFADKPIAICETGYNTADVSLSKWRIHMAGSESVQKDYLADLAKYAKRDRYLFVVYYFPIDIGPLIDTLPRPAAELASMWRENGLYDSHLNAKPALDVWKSVLAVPYEESIPVGTPVAAPTPPDAAGAVIGFERAEDLCQTPEPALTSLVDTETGRKAMQWEFPAGTRKWTWCARPVPKGGFGMSGGMRFRIRSDSDGPVFLELKAADESSYFTVVEARRDWRDVSLRWSDFKADPKTASTKDVKLDAVREIVLADDGTAAPDDGRARRIWISDWMAK